MNKIFVTGNLTKDMEVEITTNDKIHGKLSIANNVGYGENQKTNFLNCDLYGQRGDALSKYLVKGAKVLINGQINVTNIEKEDGWKTYVNVYVEDIEILKFAEEPTEEKSNKTTKTYKNYKRKQGYYKKELQIKIQDLEYTVAELKKELRRIKSTINKVEKLGLTPQTEIIVKKEKIEVELKDRKQELKALKKVAKLI